MVRVRGKITAGGGGWHLRLWFGLIWKTLIILRNGTETGNLFLR